MIGGKILDAYALAEFRVAGCLPIRGSRPREPLSVPLCLPTLALAEVRAIRPGASSELAEMLRHPSVVLGESDAAAADQVDRLLLDAGAFDFDAMAGHVVHTARQRGYGPC